MQGKVTIIIPVYNTKKYLQKCVESVCGQTYQNLQIILVDDGSTDGSSAACDALLKTDSRIEVIHKQNEGLGFTRNCGLAAATGEYVTFLDSDDWYAPSHIEHLLAAYDVDGKLPDIVFGGNTRVSHQGDVLAITRLPKRGLVCETEIKKSVMLQIIAADDESVKDLGIPMSVCFNLYKTSLIHENHIRFPSEKVVLSEDLFFNLRYLNLCHLAYFTEEAGYYYRYNPGSITRGYDEKQVERAEQFYRDLLECVEELDLGEEVYKRVERCTMAKLRWLLMRIAGAPISNTEKIKKMRALLESRWVSEILSTFQMPKYRLSLHMVTRLMMRRQVVCLWLIISVKNKFMRK